MARYNDQEAQLFDATAQSAQPEFGLTDVFTSSAASGLTRDSIGAQLVRGAQNLLDSSGNIDPLKANAEMGLDGTEFAFKEGDVVTIDQARAVAEDYWSLRKKEMIDQSAAKDSPIMTKVVDFVGGVAGSMLDPATMAINIAGGAVASGAARSLVNSQKAFNRLANLNKGAAKLAHGAYAEGVKRNLGQVILREGAESVVGATAESAIMFSEIGNERLARDITKQEALINLVAGSVLGTAFGTVLARDGRKAMSDVLGRKYGDYASDYVGAQLKIADFEAKVGIEKGTFESRVMDREVFTPRPWQKENYVYSRARTGSVQKAYLPIREDGSVVQVSHMGKGSVFTDNLTQAKNSGATVKEVDLSNLRLMHQDQFLNPDGSSTPSARNLHRQYADELFANSDAKELTEAVMHLKDKNYETGSVAPMRPSQLRAEIANLMSGKDIDEAMDLFDRMKLISKSRANGDKVLQKFLNNTGFDGFSFRGKNFSNQDAYNGIYVKFESGKKAKTGAEIAADVAEEGDKIKWEAGTKTAYQEYGEWIETKATGLIDKPRIPDVTPNEDFKPTPANSATEAMRASKETMDSFAAAKAKVAERVQTAGEAATPEDLALLKSMEEIETGADSRKIVTDEQEKAVKYLDCILRS